ncbi:hypothetical protein B0H63DRAFT_136367 [Podospora didyma]|uniref:Uncharacterized protein n=1 Tax=Podospora didyma TaxID=330526 RepID=A0AAE0NRZ0_9PEZI|nr:hypothetical protein B0H63DRAFT_136367 [Podospora didyma]
MAIGWVPTGIVWPLIVDACDWARDAAPRSFFFLSGKGGSRFEGPFGSLPAKFLWRSACTRKPSQPLPLAFL